MKVFISQSAEDEDVKVVRAEWENTRAKLEKQGYTVLERAESKHSGLPQLDLDRTKNIPMAYLSLSLAVMATEADIVAFPTGWENHVGCVIEHECCIRFGVKILYL